VLAAGNNEDPSLYLQNCTKRYPSYSCYEIMFVWLSISSVFVRYHVLISHEGSPSASPLFLSRRSKSIHRFGNVFVDEFSVYLCDTLALRPEALPSLIGEQTYLLVYIEDVQRGIASLKNKDDEVGVPSRLVETSDDLLYKVCQGLDVINASEAASVMETLGAVFDRTEAPWQTCFVVRFRILALPSISAVVSQNRRLRYLARYRPLRPLASRPEEAGRETADCDDALSPQQLCGAKRSHQTDSESDDVPSPLLGLC